MEDIELKFGVSRCEVREIVPQREKCGKINRRQGWGVARGAGQAENGGDRGGSIGLIVNSRRIRCSSEFSATANEYRVHC